MKYTFKTTYKEISTSLTYSRFGYALDLLVTVSSMHYCTSTSALSTSSSSRGLTNLTLWDSHLEGASRLDAFSVYPFPAWLLCYALGKTTDTPAASPSRSSRTKDSSSANILRPRRIGTELSHDVLTQLAYRFKWANSPTLGTDYSPRMR